MIEYLLLCLGAVIGFAICAVMTVASREERTLEKQYRVTNIHKVEVFDNRRDKENE